MYIRILFYHCNISQYCVALGSLSLHNPSSAILLPVKRVGSASNDFFSTTFHEDWFTGQKVKEMDSHTQHRDLLSLCFALSTIVGQISYSDLRSKRLPLWYLLVPRRYIFVSSVRIVYREKRPSLPLTYNSTDYFHREQKPFSWQRLLTFNYNNHFLSVDIQTHWPCYILLHKICPQCYIRRRLRTECGNNRTLKNSGLLHTCFTKPLFRLYLYRRAYVGKYLCWVMMFFSEIRL